jgi:hypothetical protein
MNLFTQPQPVTSMKTRFSMQCLGRCFLPLLLCVLIPLQAAAQPQRPPCPSDPKIKWHDCSGSLKAADGRQYTGEWQNGKSHGRGKLIYADGRVYDGGFRQGLFHGEGSFT